MAHYGHSFSELITFIILFVLAIVLIIPGLLIANVKNTNVEINSVMH